MRLLKLLCVQFFLFTISYGQIKTTGFLEGRVLDGNGNPLENASVMAVHENSGTKFGTITGKGGYYIIQGLAVGGPYLVKASYMGYHDSLADSLFIRLGETKKVSFVLQEKIIETQENIIYGQSMDFYHANKTGASLNINGDVIHELPTINRSIEDFIRLMPQYRNHSFLGQDILLNHTTLDGVSFNSSFGLGVNPGDRTGVAPISIDAVDQIQINIASYDVRYSGFNGGAVNMVTKKGENHFKASAYYQKRNDDFIGNQAGDFKFETGVFQFDMIGFDFSGPIVKNKLFFFVSYETEKNVSPATTYTANNNDGNFDVNETRVFKSDLDELSLFLLENFHYNTGSYEKYDFITEASRFIGRLDYNLNESHKLSFKFHSLNSKADQFLANALGDSPRRENFYALGFQNSNYAIQENIYSFAGEWNSVLGKNLFNHLSISYCRHDESREKPDKIFPFVDILKDGAVYTSFGTEIFTPYSSLKYSTFEINECLTYTYAAHLLLFGTEFEKYQSEDCFFPGSQGIFVYYSLEDFYTDARGYLQNPERDFSDVRLKRFIYRYSNIPGQDVPIQPLEIYRTGVFIQDRWNLTESLKLTFGIRMDVPSYKNTGYKNSDVDNMFFLDEKGKQVQYSTDKLPKTNIHYSPRFGFNWDMMKSRNMRFRGGSGLFTARPAYVWISNQVGNNGVLTGLLWSEDSDDNPLNYKPFNPDADVYRPQNITGEPAPYYELALTDRNFKFPQIWRSSIAFDFKFPLNVLSIIEFVFDKDMNGISYINSNLTKPNSVLNGLDNRPIWTQGNRIYGNISSATVIKNSNKGYGWNFSWSLERFIISNYYGKIGYSYGISKNTVDPSSMAYASWVYNTHSSNPNQPGNSFSAYSPGHRFFGALLYKKSFFPFGETVISCFFDSYSNGRSSYIVTGDLNGDGGVLNDLIYVPNHAEEMNFSEYNSENIIFTEEEQRQAWENYVSQDKYLKKRKGKYTERNGVAFPRVTKIDLSIKQNFYFHLKGNTNGIALRIDIFNFTNLLNSNWGVGKILRTNSPLLFKGYNGEGEPVYQLRSIDNKLIDKSFTESASLEDVYRFQLTVQWLFN